MTDIAKLVFEIDSTQAVQARKNLDDLTKSSDRVETSARKVRTASEQAGIGISSNSSATARATKTATEHAMAMSQAEKVMRGALVTRGESITLLLRNSQVQAKAAADEIAAAKSAASATAKAEQERTAAWKQSQAVQAEVMREQVALARVAEREEIAAAKAASAAKQQADRDAAQAAAEAAKERTRAWRQAQRVEAEVMRERVQLARSAEAAEAQAAATTASYATKVASLKAQLDPFSAVQLRLTQNTKLLDDALAHGAITADQHAAALSQVTRVALTDVQALDRLQKAHGGAGEAARLQSYQLLNLGRQGADVFVSLASGQAIWMVAIQQGAQIGEIFADAATQGVGFKAALAGIAEAAGPVIALVGPLLLIGGAFAAVAVAFNEGDKEAAKLANTLALAGSNAGITAVQFEQFSRTVAGETKTSVDSARSALLGMTETGKFTGDTIRILGADVVMFARLTGKSTADAVGYFAQMGAGVSDFAVKFQQAYGGLTQAQIEHIQLLERQGATTQAQLELSIAIHERLGKAGPENLGYLEKAWRGVGDAVKDAWTWLKMWGNEAASRANTIQNIQDQIRLNNERLQSNPASGRGGSFLDDERRQLEARNKGLQGQLSALKAVEAAEQKRVQTEATANQVQADGIAAANEHAGSWAKIAANVSLATQEIERYRKGQADIRAANPNSRELDSTSQAAAIEAAIRKRYEHLTKQPAVSSATRADVRGDNVVQQAETAALNAQLSLTKNLEELARLKGDQIDQELENQSVRLAGQVRTKQITDADAKTAISAYQRAATLKQTAVDQDLAAQLLQAELASRQATSAYLDKMAGYAAEQATTEAERNAIERISLKRRQEDEAYALAASNALKVATGEISAMAAAEAELRQRNLSIAEEESTLRKQRLAAEQIASERDAARAQNDIDLLQASSDLSRSTTERRMIAEKILVLEQAEERRKLELAAVSEASTQAERDIAKARLAILDKVHASQRATENDKLQAAYREHLDAVNDITSAFKSRDWNGVLNSLMTAFANLKVAFSRAGTTMDKVAAAAAIASGVGNAVGGTGGAALSGAASGAMAGFTLGGPVGALAGGIIGGIGGIFGSSKAKKQAKAQAAAQKAAEEAQRQQTIADTEFALNVALLRAQGEETKATNMERDKEIARLQGISQASADLQKQLWALDDAATAAAAAAEKAAAVEASRSSIQDEIDKLTMSDAELLAKTRKKERAEAAALDPTLGALIDRLYRLEDASTAAAQAAADQEARAKAFNDAITASMKRSEDSANKAAAAQQNLVDQQNAVVDAGNNAAAAFRVLASNLTDFADSISGGALANIDRSYGATRAAFLGSSGADTITSGKAFLDASATNSTSTLGYQFDAAVVRAKALSEAAAAQASAKSQEFGAMLIAAILGGQTDVISRAFDIPGFANGGSLVLGGIGGVDTNTLALNGQPIANVSAGEILSVTPAWRGSNDNGTDGLLTEVRALRAEVAALRQVAASIDRSNGKMERTLTSVTEGGRAMQTEAAS